DKVIILGPDHHVGFKGASITDADYYVTPLGKVPVHEDAKRILKEPLFKTVSQSDAIEHSVEVEIPFLQYVLKDFTIIPIVVGLVDEKKIATVLQKYIDDNTLVVISSDLSHYLDYKTAIEKDTKTLSSITGFEFDKLKESKNAACGKLPILILMHIARERGWRPVLLNYTNSGDTAGDKERVVGYAALAYYQESGTDKSALLPEEGRYLLTIARDAIETYTLHNKVIESVPFQISERLHEKRGTFVTLTIDEKLRGCIGTIVPHVPLWKGVRDNAISAAFKDPRFPPLSKTELDRIHIEVSVLTSPRVLVYTDEKDLLSKLRPCIDGVILKKGFSQATFLPQVWDQLPKKKKFLAHLCQKAGLSPDAWRYEKLEVSTYQVQAFEEKE
ncbi:MAG: AmmeMemoRadiSam system protein A, partial [Thermodesulfobacteriota bacterium]|nr:AmmeMemoRadiSam system protein A [Thermodesulfobacteriota bacterium]